MKNSWKPIIAFCLLTPLLVEVLSTNTPLSIQISQPLIYVLFATIGYGFPVLALREIVVRKNLGLVGLFVLGLAYAIYNEGLVAKTFFNPFSTPLPMFSGYHLVLGIKIPWMIVISWWHALHSVIYPLVIIYFLFPGQAMHSWLTKRTAWFFGVISLVFGLLTFFQTQPGNPSGKFLHFMVMLGVWLVLWRIAVALPPVPKISFSSRHTGLRKLGWGFFLWLSFIFIPILFADWQMPLAVFLGYFIVISTLWLWGLSRVSEIPLISLFMVALGGELTYVFFTGLLSLGNLEKLVTSLVFAVIFISTALTIKLRNRKLEKITEIS